MCAAVAMRADVNNKRLGRYLDLVGANEEQHVDLACGHLGRIEPTGAGHEAEVERSYTRGGVMQTEEPVPPSLLAPNSTAAFAASQATARPSLPEKTPAAKRERR